MKVFIAGLEVNEINTRRMEPAGRLEVVVRASTKHTDATFYLPQDPSFHVGDRINVTIERVEDE